MPFLLTKQQKYLKFPLNIKLLISIIMIALQEKKTSFKRTIKNFVARSVLLRPLKRGHKVWKNLNKVLPNPTGSHSDDIQRIKDFKELIKTISFIDYYALETWLKFIYKDTEDMSFGLHTGREETFCTKWMQIYSEHYNAME